MNLIAQEDLEHMFQNLSENEIGKLQNSTILVTGAGGFLGYYFVHFLVRYFDELNLNRIILLENFLTGNKDWIQQIIDDNPDKVALYEFNVITDSIEDIPEAMDCDFVIHMASIASPSFYRMYPIETVDANITGLRRLFDFFKDKHLKGFLFFSSSEIYGDPFPEFIPTSEDYRGNVATMGPRACYDEAKRFGETLSYLFHEKYGLPVRIARPFNNYGPGMNINDRRLPADFAKAVLEGKDLSIHSDGSPTRTFCYISDAITGYFKVLLHNQFDVFNIGMDQPEISVKKFADIFVQQGRHIFNYDGSIRFEPSVEKSYLTDNPNRRCPDISKARRILNFNPTIQVEEGIERYLKFLSVTYDVLQSNQHIL